MRRVPIDREKCKPIETVDNNIRVPVPIIISASLLLNETALFSAEGERRRFSRRRRLSQARWQAAALLAPFTLFFVQYSR